MAIAQPPQPITNGAARPQPAAPFSEATLTINNPITGERLREVPITSRAGVEAAAKHARSAQNIWRAVSPKERGKLLAKFGDLLWERHRDVMKTIRAETGKSDTSAFLEVMVVIQLAYWLKHHAPHILASERRLPVFPILEYSIVHRKPYGLVGFITPWNYPALLVYQDVLPALAAGNCVIIKPSDVAPLTAMHIADLLHEVGLPDGVLQVVTGDGTTGSALVEVVDFIHFTGSTEVGRKVAVKAAERLIPYGLELGGKNPLLVLRDADPQLAATVTLLYATENAGQVCISPERVYVEAPIYDAYLQHLKQAAESLIISNRDGFDVQMGSMTNERELLHAEACVADALEKGATLIYGGKRRPDLGPYFYEPPILVNVDHSMRIMQEEIFGPVVPIMKVDNEADAIRLANASEFGLSAVIITGDVKRGEHLAQQLNAGDVTINQALVVAGSHWLPWGGGKKSGNGRRGGAEGILRFTEPQTVLVDRGIGIPKTLDVLKYLVSGMKLLTQIRRYIPFI